MPSAKASPLAARIALSSSGPLNDLPSGSVPEGSIGNLPSLSRQRPIASKFSSPKPSGSMRAWQDAQIGFVAVLLHLLRSDAELADGRFVEGRHVRRRRRERRVQQRFQHPLAAQHGRGSGGIDDTVSTLRLRQDAAALRAVELDAAELRPVDAANPVVARRAPR